LPIEDLYTESLHAKVWADAQREAMKDAIRYQYELAAKDAKHQARTEAHQARAQATHTAAVNAKFIKVDKLLEAQAAERMEFLLNSKGRDPNEFALMFARHKAELAALKAEPLPTPLPAKRSWFMRWFG
jgi:hypothetical protein